VFNINSSEQEISVVMNAIVDVDYSPLLLTSNPTMYSEQFEHSNLTEPSGEITSIGQPLRGDMLLNTMANTSNYVNSYMTYTKEDSQNVVSATVALQRKYGTCKEFAVLDMALFNTMGLKNRLAFGYMFNGEIWEPHGWVEVYNPANQEWISVDPTSNELQRLSALRIKVAQYPDSTCMKDIVLVKGTSDGKFALTNTIEINMESTGAFKDVPEVNVTFQKPNMLLFNFMNNGPYVLPVTVSISLPWDPGTNKTVIVIPPRSSITITRKAEIPVGSTATVEYWVHGTGLDKRGSVNVTVEEAKPPGGGGDGGGGLGVDSSLLMYAGIVIVLLLIALAVIYKVLAGKKKEK